MEWPSEITSLGQDSINRYLTLKALLLSGKLMNSTLAEILIFHNFRMGTGQRAQSAKAVRVPGPGQYEAGAVRNILVVSIVNSLVRNSRVAPNTP